MDSEAKIPQAAVPTSYALEVISEGGPPQQNGSLEDAKRSERKQERAFTVPYHKLFSFADSTDYLLMSVGTISSAGNGVTMPLMTLLFGWLVDSFGKSANHKLALHAVSEVLYCRVCAYGANSFPRCPDCKAQCCDELQFFLGV